MDREDITPKTAVSFDNSTFAIDANLWLNAAWPLK